MHEICDVAMLDAGIGAMRDWDAVNAIWSRHPVLTRLYQSIGYFAGKHAALETSRKCSTSGN